MLDVAFGILLALWLLTWGQLMLYAIPVLLALGIGAIAAALIVGPGPMLLLIIVLAIVAMARSEVRRAKMPGREVERVGWFRFRL